MKKSKWARSDTAGGDVHGAARAHAEAQLQARWDFEISFYKDAMAHLAELPEKDGQTMDCLQFWASREDSIPLLAACAAAILAQPAQAAASERVFSALSRVVTKYRCRLNHRLAGQLVVSSMRDRAKRAAVKLWYTLVL